MLDKRMFGMNRGLETRDGLFTRYARIQDVRWSIEMVNRNTSKLSYNVGAFFDAIFFFFFVLLNESNSVFVSGA